MLPLPLLQKISELCSDQPFAFLSPEQQADMRAQLLETTGTFLKKFEDKNLQQTHAYQILKQVEQAVTTEPIDELALANALVQLHDLYLGHTPPEDRAAFEAFGDHANQFKKRALEFSVRERSITKATDKMSLEEIHAHDLKILHDVGVFYVLEYTLTLAQELLKTDDAGKNALFADGLKTKSGNLPGLLPLIKSFQYELGFQIFDHALRIRILKIFFQAQKQFMIEDLAVRQTALQQFHRDLIEVFLAGGLTNFVGFFYKPFPDNTPLQEIKQRV